jgi:hypothetical protein
MEKIFLTFADSRMKNSIKRICKQAEDMDFYDRILGFDENNLDSDFRKKFKKELVYGSRGYGYWCWKPQVILQALETMNDGDILQYTDAGCHLNKKGINRLEEYFLFTKNSKQGILVFQSKPPEPPLIYDNRKLLYQPDYKWIKGDLLDYLNVRNNELITNTETIGATVIFIKKDNTSKDIIDEWLSIIIKDFSFIDNTPSKSDNMHGFIEHRHDQAIFSLLCKLKKIKTLSAYEYWYPSKNFMIPDWKALENYPIHAKRDKDLGSIKNLINLIIRILRKILLLIIKR